MAWKHIDIEEYYWAFLINSLSLYIYDTYKWYLHDWPWLWVKISTLHFLRHFSKMFIIINIYRMIESVSKTFTFASLVSLLLSPFVKVHSLILNVGWTKWFVFFVEFWQDLKKNTLKKEFSLLVSIAWWCDHQKIKVISLCTNQTKIVFIY